MRQALRQTGLGVLALLGLGLSGCHRAQPGSLARIRQRGTLIVLTRNAPTTYYIGRNDHPRGPEYQMVEAFAHSIGVQPKFVVKSSVAELMRALRNGEGDMIAAGLTRTPSRAARFQFGPAYQRVRQEVVCRRGGPQPDTVDALAHVHLEVVADSSYVARLKSLQATHPALHWSVDADDGTEQLLRRVWAGELDCTVADSDIVAINRRYFPNLVVAFDLSSPQPLAWVLPRHADALAAAMRHWMDGYTWNGGLAALMRRYYGHVRVFDYVDTRTYVHRIKSRFPTYKPLFFKAAKAHDLPPLVLAAQAYQESHWNPHATSPTGVRGMMMLTRSTAHAVGVRNRLNPRASIDGGAVYLARLEQRLSDSITPGDRIWFALAAYNVGLAHVRDARRLTRRLGKDPNRWADVSQVLPLLSQHRYYHMLKHGYARGTEPVRYIQRIRNYADILRHKLRQTAQVNPQSVATNASG